MKIPVTYLVLFFLAGVLIPCVRAQRQSPVESPQDPKLIPRASDEGRLGQRISIDVVVADASGNPVPGIGQQFFTLLDNQQPKPLYSFQAVLGAQATPPDTAILLIDLVNTPAKDVAAEQTQLVAFLRQNHGHLSMPTSIVVLGDEGLTIGHPSLDGNALAANLGAMMDKPRTLVAKYGWAAPVYQRRLSDAALNEMVRSEHSKPGRKLLIWIGPGWFVAPSDPHDVLVRQQVGSPDPVAMLDDLAERAAGLRAARITLYNINPVPVKDDPNRGFDYRKFLAPVTTPSQLQDGNRSLPVLAIESGGLVLRSTSDLAGDMQKCLTDASAYYTLIFDRPPATAPDEYHSISVQVNRPGVTVRTRHGYYSTP